MSNDSHQTRTVRGHLDCVRGRTVFGWAWSPDQPTARLTVRAFVDGVLASESIARGYRPDLQDAGIGDGRHSFTLLLPLSVMDGAEHDVAVISDDGFQLARSPVRLILPEFRFVPQPPDVSDYPVEIAVCAIAKNEAPYLLEWIAYHRVLGVGHFLIFDNDSDDGTFQLLDRLAAQGVVERVAWPSTGDTAPQLTAYAEGLSRLRHLARWIAFIDLDEFLHPLADPDLGTVLRGYEDVAGLVVPWRVFGSSGREIFEDDLVIRRFTRRARDDDPLNNAVKSIVRSRCVGSTGVHTPTMAQGCLVDEHREVAGVQGDPDCHPVPTARRLVINHYFGKSRAEWELKRRRGRATRRAGDSTHVRPDSYFAAHDKNDVDDIRILRFESAVRAEMKALLSAMEPG
jgi:hypothetical protein